MNNLTIAGGIGKDAETRTTQSGKNVTSFSVAVSKGRDKETIWFDCSIWGERGDKVAQYIRKGGKITVSGEVSAREHNGKAYLQIFVRDFTLQGGGRDDSDQGYGNDQGRQAPPDGGYGDLDDFVPF